MTDYMIRQLRQEYRLPGLEEAATPVEPHTLFEAWFEAAVAAGIREPNGMALATASTAGQPSVRIVLLKTFDERGFVFFTNYHSRKGEEIEANPQAAATFWWADLERQVRIEGTIEAIPPTESDAYYNSRPRGSRLGAWASPQSRPIPNRELLENNLAALERRYGQEKPIPRPFHWGGFRLKPAVIEFWQGRRNRLHDRLVYRPRPEGGWDRQRLAP